APHLSSCSEAALDFVENQQHLVLVADLAEPLEEFTSEMIVAALALDRLDDDRRNINTAFLNETADLLLRSLCSRDHVGCALRFRQRKIDRRIRDARPFEFGEQIRLARIGIRQAHGVAAAAVEGVLEMENLSAAFAASRRDIFSHL